MEISNDKIKSVHLIGDVGLFNREKNTNNFEIYITSTKKKYKFQSVEKLAIFEIFNIIQSRDMINKQNSINSENRNLLFRRKCSDKNWPV